MFNMAYDKATQGTPTVSSGNQYVVTLPFCTTAAGAVDPTCANWSFGTETNSLVDFGENPNFAYLGAHFFTQADAQKTLFLRDDATWRRGEHTIKFGGQLNFLNLQRTVINFTNPSFFYFNPGPTGNFNQLTQQPEAALIATGSNPSLDANDIQAGIYVQDEWKPDIHWTVNAGIRYDYGRIRPTTSTSRQSRSRRRCGTIPDGRRAVSIPRIISRTATTGRPTRRCSSRVSVSRTT